MITVICAGIVVWLVLSVLVSLAVARVLSWAGRPLSAIGSPLDDGVDKG